jgi:hypothetical protein
MKFDFFLSLALTFYTPSSRRTVVFFRTAAYIYVTATLTTFNLLYKPRIRILTQCYHLYCVRRFRLRPQLFLIIWAITLVLFASVCLLLSNKSLQQSHHHPYQCPAASFFTNRSYNCYYSDCLISRHIKLHNRYKLYVCNLMNSW